MVKFHKCEIDIVEKSMHYAFGDLFSFPISYSANKSREFVLTGNTGTTRSKQETRKGMFFRRGVSSRLSAMAAWQVCNHDLRLASAVKSVNASLRCFLHQDKRLKYICNAYRFTEWISMNSIFKYLRQFALPTVFDCDLSHELQISALSTKQ